MSKRDFWIKFLQLTASVFIMFFFAVTLGESTAGIILKMNDKAFDKTILDHAVFWTGAFVSTGIWGLLWLWFKKSEKVCVDTTGTVEQK